MPETWFFDMDGDNVDIVCRAEGGGGTVGDGHYQVGPKSGPILDPKGLTYAALAHAGAGHVMIQDDGSFEIIAASNAKAPGPDDGMGNKAAADITDDDLRALFAPDVLQMAGIDPKG